MEEKKELKVGNKTVFKLYGTKIQLMVTYAKKIPGGWAFRGNTKEGVSISGRCDANFNYGD